MKNCIKQYLCKEEGTEKCNECTEKETFVEHMIKEIDRKENEYVRVTNYENKTAIGKVIKVTENSYVVDTQNEDTSGEYGKCCKAKHSTNLIDLIEENDYINGARVEKSKYGELYTAYTYMGGDIDRQVETYICFIKDLKEDDIETILTHEQYENNSYKVKTVGNMSIEK